MLDEYASSYVPLFEMAIYFINHKQDPSFGFYLARYELV